MSEQTTPETRPDRAAAQSEGGGGFKRVWKEWIKPFLMVLIVVGSLRSAVADWNDVPTGSMRPTILEGERIFVNKLAYDLKVPFTRMRVAKWGAPDRGDVVVLYSPADGKRLVKRVIGIPGDVLELRNNHLLVNGEAAEYQPFDVEDRAALGLGGEPEEDVEWETVDSVTHPVTWTPFQPSRRYYGPLRVPDGKYYVMGDNRDNSRDSRWFGVVDRELIVGRATAVVVSFDPERSYAPRWDRFFLGLP